MYLGTSRLIRLMKVKMDKYPMISKERKQELREKIKGLQLPFLPEVSCRKETLLTGEEVYIVRHKNLGDLGRILILQNGENCQLSFEVIGDEDDPGTVQRKEVFEPISHEISHLMESIFGKGNGTIKPYESPVQIQSFRAERIECNKCGACVAFIVYAPPNATPAVLEDNVRHSFSKAKEFNVPTWVISEESKVLINNMYVPRLLSLKFFPERESIKYILGTELDDILCPLVEKHCR